MASNGSTLADPADGHYEDWFEIYNAGTTSVDLGGFYVSDAQDEPTQYRIQVLPRYSPFDATVLLLPHLRLPLASTLPSRLGPSA